jgi:hypothetical protein
MKMSSGMLRRVVSYKLTDVSEVLTASFVKATHRTDEERMNYKENMKYIRR